MYKHTQALEFLSVGSVQIGAILLCGLFVYDVFWVFCTPVMVAVAKSFDAPIKLLFPRMLASLLTGEVSHSSLSLSLSPISSPHGCQRPPYVATMKSPRVKRSLSMN